MAAPPPAKKAKGSNTISMVIGRWKNGEDEQFSSVQRVSGFPWRLMVVQSSSVLESGREAFLLCDKSKEAEVWSCSANISASFISSPITRIFDNWYERNKQCLIGKGDFREGTRVEVEITTEDDGDTGCRNYHSLDPMAVHDGALLVGDKKVSINKEWLASQSPFFDRLLFGDLKEKEMSEIPIGGVEYEELANIILLAYNCRNASVTDQNVNRVMELADRFGIKIIEDRVVNYLFSSSSLPLIKKLLITDKYQMNDLKSKLLYECSYSLHHLALLHKDPEWKQLSNETMGHVLTIVCMPR